MYLFTKENVVINTIIMKILDYYNINIKLSLNIS